MCWCGIDYCSVVVCGFVSFVFVVVRVLGLGLPVCWGVCGGLIMVPGISSLGDLMLPGGGMCDWWVLWCFYCVA